MRAHSQPDRNATVRLIADYFAKRTAYTYLFIVDFRAVLADFVLHIFFAELCFWVYRFPLVFSLQPEDEKKKYLK